MTCLRDSVYISCHWKLCHYADCYWDLRTKHRHFSINTFIFYEAFNPETSCNNTSSLSSNKPKRYLRMLMCCCGLEFQFLSVPVHSRPPSRSTFPHSTFPTHHHLWDKKYQICLCYSLRSVYSCRYVVPYLKSYD